MSSTSLRRERAAARHRRFERRVRPLALYGLACMPPLWTFSVVYSVRVGLGAQPMAPLLDALVSAWGITVVLSLLATLPAGFASLSSDTELTSGSRTRWAAVFLLTWFFGTAVFVLRRWHRERAGRR